MAEHGVIFIATQADRYIDEAFLSAESVRRHAPDIPITLFTDRPSHPLCRTACFDTVKAIAGSTAGDARANAMLNRFIGLGRTPYARSLYLDTDARLMRPAPGLFDMLDDCDVAMAEDAPGTSQARTHTGRRMFNCGVILYRREAAAAWLKPWEEAARRNLALAREMPPPLVPEIAAVSDPNVRKWLLEVDKIALLGVLPPDNAQGLARVMTLGNAWNYRAPAPAPGTYIHHPYDRANVPAAGIREVALRWRAAGRADAGFLLAYAETII